MIKLEKSKIENLKIDYFRKIFPKIENSAASYKKEFEELFPKAYINNQLNEEFFNDVLCLPIDETRKKYESVDNYFHLCLIRTLNMVEICRTKSNKNRSKYPKIRETAVNEHYNSMLKEIIKATKNVDYYNSKKKYDKLIEDIENKCKVIDKIISYNLIDSDYRHELMEKMGVDVCPYCNRQYTTLYNYNGQNKTTADLDHFFYKHVFSLFSLSLYNFIPSCQICNQRFKKDKYVKMFNPYERGYDNDAYFDVEKNGALWEASTLMGWSDDFEVVLKYSTQFKDIEFLKEESKTFHIEELYKYHKEYVRELLLKKSGINETFRNQISEMLEGDRLSDEEIDILLYGQSLKSQNFTKKPLSKLTYDILVRKIK